MVLEAGNMIRGWKYEDLLAGGLKGAAVLDEFLKIEKDVLQFSEKHQYEIKIIEDKHFPWCAVTGFNLETRINTALEDYKSILSDISANGDTAKAFIRRWMEGKMREAEMAEHRKRKASDSGLDVETDSVGTSGDSYSFVGRPISGVYTRPKRSCRSRVHPGSKSPYGSLKTGTMSEPTKPAQIGSNGSQISGFTFRMLPPSNEPTVQSTSPASGHDGSTLSLAFRPAPPR
jgi:hypothetical protein